jgi:hypothetical protein
MSRPRSHSNRVTSARSMDKRESRSPGILLTERQVNKVSHSLILTIHVPFFSAYTNAPITVDGIQITSKIANIRHSSLSSPLAASSPDILTTIDPPLTAPPVLPEQSNDHHLFAYASLIKYLYLRQHNLNITVHSIPEERFYAKAPLNARIQPAVNMVGISASTTAQLTRSLNMLRMAYTYSERICQTTLCLK